MRTLRYILPVLLLTVACGPKLNDKSIEQLKVKRDSLQSVQQDIALQIVKLNKQIALLDTSNHQADKIKLIKKIAMQKGRVVKMDKKVKDLENELASMRKKEKLVPVAIKELKPETFNHYIIVYGNVNAKKYANISPEMSGRLEEIYVTEGQYVKSGSLIASLNTSAIKKQIDGVESQLELAREVYKKQSALWEQGVGSQIEYLRSKNNKDVLEAQLESLKAQLKMSQVKAPFDGLVNKINIKIGELASPMMPMVEFVNLSKMEVLADVSETYLGEIKKGEIVEVTFANIPDTLKTPVKRISSVIDPKSRTFEIELEVENKDNILKPNVVSTIRINDYSSNNALVVPSAVIGKDRKGDYVYIVSNDNKVEKKYITMEQSYNENTRITGDINVGDKVVVEGYHTISSGVDVDVKEIM